MHHHNPQANDNYMRNNSQACIISVLSNSSRAQQATLKAVRLVLDGMLSLIQRLKNAVYYLEHTVGSIKTVKN